MENPEKVAIGNRLKEFCDKKFDGVKEFSEAIGMKTRNQIYDYFNGKYLLGSEYLAKIVELGCDINWLLTGRQFEDLYISKPTTISIKKPNLRLAGNKRIGEPILKTNYEQAWIKRSNQSHEELLEDHRKMTKLLLIFADDNEELQKENLKLKEKIKKLRGE